MDADMISTASTMASVDADTPLTAPTMAPSTVAVLTLCFLVTVVGVILNVIVIVIFLAEKLLQGATSNVHVFSQR